MITPDPCPPISASHRQPSAALRATFGCHLRRRSARFLALLWVRAFGPVGGPGMPAADICPPIPTPHGTIGAWQAGISLRVTQTNLHAHARPFTRMPSGQITDFRDIGRLIRQACLLCGSCMSGQRFASGFLPAPPHDVAVAVRLRLPCGYVKAAHLLGQITIGSPSTIMHKHSGLIWKENNVERCFAPFGLL